MSKKSIDELFKERFNDFAEIPDPKVWGNIEKSLDKKDSKRVIPIWWKLGGIAAAIAVFLYVVNPFDTVTDNNIQISNTQEQAKDSTDSSIKTKAPNQEGYTNSDSQENDVLEAEQQLQENVSKTPSYVQENSSSKEQENNTSKSASKNKIKQQFSPSNDALVQESQKPKTNTDVTAVAQNNIQDKSNDNKGLVANKEESAVTTANESKNGKTIEQNRGTLIKTPQEQNLNHEQSQNAIAEVAQKELLEPEKADEKKKSILDELEKEKEVIAENKSNKWSVGPNVAPVYFNGMGEGSPIHSSFAPNSKSGDVNLSYGVSVAYEVSKRLKVRSGVYKVDYGYNTNEIEFSSSLGSSFASNGDPQISNINYKSTSKSIVVQSTASERVNSLSTPSFASDATAKSAALQGSLTQQFGYIEVPFELNYTVLDKKFGVNLIGGMSSLFLVNNDILLNSGDQTTEMGEANNINSVNFSTNFGFGINYKFTPKLQFNVEPLFKYQLNTFSNSAGNFQPFSVGVYSGINFRF